MKDKLSVLTLSLISLWALTYDLLNQYLTIFIAFFTAIWIVFKVGNEVIMFLDKIKKKRNTE